MSNSYRELLLISSLKTADFAISNRRFSFLRGIIVVRIVAELSLMKGDEGVNLTQRRAYGSLLRQPRESYLCILQRGL